MQRDSTRSDSHTSFRFDRTTQNSRVTPKINDFKQVSNPQAKSLDIPKPSPTPHLPSAEALAALHRKRQISDFSVHKITPVNKPKIDSPSSATTNSDVLQLPVRTLQGPRLNKTSQEFNRNTIPQGPTVPNEEPVVTSQRRNKLHFAFIAAGILVFISGATVAFQGFRVNQQVASQVQGGQVQSVNVKEDDDVNPDETPQDNNVAKNHIAAPENPRRIIIPKLNVNTRIMPLGLKSDNQLKAPSNIYDTGWYDRSAKPGQPGAMLIDGHVHGPTKPAVFYSLKKLVKDDVISVERGDGKVFTYKVAKTQNYDAENTDMAAALTPVEAGKPGLNLITCSGKLDKKTNLYTERTIVFATLVQ